MHWTYLLPWKRSSKEKYLPKLASGEFIGAWGLTEANTGSDAMRMQTTAVKDGNDWIINGAKNWITHGLSGDLAVILVRTGELLDSNGITAFIIEKDMPGFSAVKIKDKLGVRASETAELIFDNVRVPQENVLGNIGDGFKQAMQILDGGRVSIASLSCGIARGAYESSVKYAKEREQFGHPIAQFQAIAFKLADMKTQLEAAELLTFQAAYRKRETSYDQRRRIRQVLCIGGFGEMWQRSRTNYGGLWIYKRVSSREVFTRRKTHDNW